jgi:hypothetical protein
MRGFYPGSTQASYLNYGKEEQFSFRSFTTRTPLLTCIENAH